MSSRPIVWEPKIYDDEAKNNENSIDYEKHAIINSSSIKSSTYISDVSKIDRSVKITDNNGM